LRFALRILLRPGFSRLWLSFVASWSAWATSQVVLSWGVLARTNSAVDLGILFALRMLPMTVGGIPLGMLADRWGRHRLLVITNLGAAGVAIALAAALTGSGPEPFFVAAVALGFLDAGRIVASQSLTYDLAGHDHALSAIAVANLITGVGGGIGAALGGVVLEAYGLTAAVAVLAGQYGLGALPLLGGRARQWLAPSPAAQSAPSPTKARAGRRPIVVLSLVAVTIEILGFSALTLDSVFATQVFAAGALGLGLIGAARSVGRLVGSLLLAAEAKHYAPARALAAAVTIFGAGLVGYAATGSLWIGAAFTLVTGAAGATVDSLLQVLLQLLVADSARGVGMGVWVFSVGLAPLGALEVGYLAAVTGPQIAEAANGLLLLCFAAVLLFGPLLGGIGVVAERLRAGTSALMVEDS
jgi:MFS family permease